MMISTRTVPVSSPGTLVASLLTMGIATVLLEPGVNVFEFTPQETGRLHYSCAMGMYRGVVDVVAARAQRRPVDGIGHGLA